MLSYRWVVGLEKISGLPWGSIGSVMILAVGVPKEGLQFPGSGCTPEPFGSTFTICA